MTVHHYAFSRRKEEGRIRLTSIRSYQFDQRQKILAARIPEFHKTVNYSFMTILFICKWRKVTFPSFFCTSHVQATCQNPSNYNADGRAI